MNQHWCGLRRYTRYGYRCVMNIFDHDTFVFFLLNIQMLKERAL
jgi:hypothetical protein